MACSSNSTTRVARFVARCASQFRALFDSFSRPSYSSTTLVEHAPSKHCGTSSATSPGLSCIGNILGHRHFSSSGGSSSATAEFAGVPISKLALGSRLRDFGGQKFFPQIVTGGLGFAGAQLVRTIMVEVKGNDLDRAIRKWRRKCKEENLKILKDREYFKKPSEKRVLALKERDRRISRRSFKMKLNWIMGRRQRGF